jgi:hypothetical protein
MVKWCNGISDKKFQRPSGPPDHHRGLHYHRIRGCGPLLLHLSLISYSKLAPQHYPRIPPSCKIELRGFNSRVSKKTRFNQRTIIPPEPSRTCTLMRMTGSKKYSPVGTKAQPRVGLDFLSEKIPLHHFTFGFQKPGICADSWFLESNGKMVQWDFLCSDSPASLCIIVSFLHIQSIELFVFSFLHIELFTEISAGTVRLRP